MENKKSSLKAKLTYSQWLAFDTLSTMLKAQLPEFSLVGIPDGEIWKLTRANTRRSDLWELLQKRILIEHRIVAECCYEFKPIIKSPINEGEEWAEKREVIFCLHLIPKKNSNLLSEKYTPDLFLKIQFEMYGDVADLEVRKIIFIPQSKDQSDTIFLNRPLSYEIA